MDGMFSQNEPSRALLRRYHFLIPQYSWTTSLGGALALNFSVMQPSLLIRWLMVLWNADVIPAPLGRYP